MPPHRQTFSLGQDNLKFCAKQRLYVGVRSKCPPATLPGVRPVCAIPPSACQISAHRKTREPKPFVTRRRRADGRPWKTYPLQVTLDDLQTKFEKKLRDEVQARAAAQRALERYEDDVRMQEKTIALAEAKVGLLSGER